jgi:hypothetical protein
MDPAVKHILYVLTYTMAAMVLLPYAAAFVWGPGSMSAETRGFLYDIAKGIYSGLLVVVGYMIPKPRE